MKIILNAKTSALIIAGCSLASMAQDHIALLVRTNGAGAIYVEANSSQILQKMIGNLGAASNSDIIVYSEEGTSISVMQATMRTFATNGATKLRLVDKPVSNLPASNEIKWRDRDQVQHEGQKPENSIHIVLLLNSLLVDGQSRSLDSLNAYLETLRPVADYEIFIKSGKGSVHSDLIRVINAVSENGFTHVSIAPDEDANNRTEVIRPKTGKNSSAILKPGRADGW